MYKFSKYLYNKSLFQKNVILKVKESLEEIRLKAKERKKSTIKENLRGKFIRVNSKI